MKQDVMLFIRGRQRYEGQEPDVIELVTEGVSIFREKTQVQLQLGAGNQGVPRQRGEAGGVGGAGK